MGLIAAAHILGIGPHLRGGLFNLYYSYFSDIAIPFAYYFLLCVAEAGIPLFRRWETKFATVFLLPTIAETCQYLGIPVLGSTFDPLDYLMYGIGASFAALLDTQVFPRFIKSWSTERAQR